MHDLALHNLGQEVWIQRGRYSFALQPKYYLVSGRYAWRLESGRDHLGSLAGV